jgi:pyruvate/2-oxoglutarate dehydrogenase complex dihydrolipoamide acyltransferase (E2) component
VHDTAQKVGEPGVRELRLGFRGAAGQRLIAPGDRSVDPGEPERRLSDPRLAVHHHGAGQLVARVENVDDRLELLVPAYQRAGRCGHVAVSCAAVAFEFKLPDLGEGLTEAEIARWLVEEGQRIDEDQPLVEVQTDKTTVEIPSPRAGTVLKILVEEGEIAPVGAVLVVIGEEGEQLLRAVEGNERDAGTAPAEPLVAIVPPEPVDAVRATPAVRALAKELGVELVGLHGTGPSGRIQEADVRAAVVTGDERRVPIRGIRRAIVEQVSRAHHEIPAVTFVEECDFTDVDVARLVPLAIHASAGALRERPELNARLDGEQIVFHERIDVGVAVQTDEGLVVPVVRGCERLSVDEIAAEVQRLAEAARTGTLAAEELRGSTFTVTSAGKLGGLLVTPLVNHPEVAILGLHRIGERPVVRDGEIVVRRMGNVSVTFDHRVVDGVVAAAFCLDVIDRLQSDAAGAA